MIAPTAIIRGVGLNFNFDMIDVPETTGFYNSNLNNKMIYAVDAIKSGKYDFGFVHIKAVDDAGHDKDYDMKVKQLEKSDKAVELLIKLLGQLDEDTLIVITGDHTTPVHYGDHTSEPVPVLISSAHAARSGKALPWADMCDRFDEVACGLQGGLGRFCGNHIIEVTKKLMQK